MTTPAVETRGLVKEFEKGRRTIWQRLRREPDRRERFRAVDGIDLRVEAGEIFGARTVLDPALTYAALLVTSAAILPLGLWAFRAADRWVRVHGTIAQH